MAAAGSAFALTFYGWGIAYVGSNSKLWIAGVLAGSAIVSAAGVVYAWFLLSRRPECVSSLALAPLAYSSTS